MVTVQIGPYRASIDAGVWQSDNADLLGVLQTMHPQGVSSAFPDKDLAQALDAVEQLGGEVVSKSEPLPAAEGDDLVY